MSTAHPRTHVALVVKLRRTLLLLLDNLQKLSEIWTTHNTVALHVTQQPSVENARVHTPMEPLMLSSTSLIIWNSSSSVGFWPMAATTKHSQSPPTHGGQGASLTRRKAGMHRAPSNLQRQTYPPELAGAPTHQWFLTYPCRTLGMRPGIHQSPLGSTASWPAG